MKKKTKVALILGGAVLDSLIWFSFIRPRLVNWGAEDYEKDMELPGDYRIGDKLRWTRAVTIHRPPEEVWPWVAQWGRGGGYYAWDYLLNGNRPSADYLLDLPEPAVGDTGAKMGRIVQVEPGRDIVWQNEGLYPCFGSSLDVRTEMHLEAVGLGATRLIQRISLDWRGWTGLIKAMLIEPGDATVNKLVLKRIQRLAETWPHRRDEGKTNSGVLGDHQADDIQYAATNPG